MPRLFFWTDTQENQRTIVFNYSGSFRCSLGHDCFLQCIGHFGNASHNELCMTLQSLVGGISFGGLAGLLWLVPKTQFYDWCKSKPSFTYQVFCDQNRKNFSVYVKQIVRLTLVDRRHTPCLFQFAILSPIKRLWSGLSLPLFSCAANLRMKNGTAETAECHPRQAQRSGSLGDSWAA